MEAHCSFTSAITKTDKQVRAFQNQDTPLGSMPLLGDTNQQTDTQGSDSEAPGGGSPNYAIVLLNNCGYFRVPPHIHCCVMY